jgi:hypothetical protein
MYIIKSNTAIARGSVGLFLFAALILSCNNNQVDQVTTEAESDSLVSAAAPNVPVLPELPSNVILKNWEMGDPQHMATVWKLYQAWDTEHPHDMIEFLGDSTIFDWPNGSRVITTKETVEPILRKWRNNFKSTSNIPFSLISIHNKDLNQDWVMAWVWNKWETAQGKKDSSLFCDNWRLVNGRIVYMNSSENRTSRSLSKTLNSIPSN